jgi:hypothetical protein
MPILGYIMASPFSRDLPVRESIIRRADAMRRSASPLCSGDQARKCLREPAEVA